jgi:hypothetical protein
MTERNKPELPIPPKVLSARQRMEIARIWNADGDLHVSLAPNAFPDPGAWGLALVDLAKHVANACHQASGTPTSEVLGRIKAAFDAEWSNPTDVPTGGLMK